MNNDVPEHSLITEQAIKDAIKRHDEKLPPPEEIGQIFIRYDRTLGEKFWFTGKSFFDDTIAQYPFNDKNQVWCKNLKNKILGIAQDEVAVVEETKKVAPATRAFPRTKTVATQTLVPREMSDEEREEWDRNTDLGFTPW